MIWKFCFYHHFNFRGSFFPKISKKSDFFHIFWPADVIEDTNSKKDKKIYFDQKIPKKVNILLEINIILFLYCQMLPISNISTFGAVSMGGENGTLGIE